MKFPRTKSPTALLSPVSAAVLLLLGGVGPIEGRSGRSGGASCGLRARLASGFLSVYRRRILGPVHWADRGIAQPGSAAVLGTAGRWFESSCPDQ